MWALCCRLKSQIDCLLQRSALGNLLFVLFAVSSGLYFIDFHGEFTYARYMVLLAQVM